MTADMAHQTGVARSGIGRALNKRRQGLAIHRAHRADRPTRALSVAMPVLAYICRYNLEMSTKASLDFKDRTQKAPGSFADGGEKSVEQQRRYRNHGALPYPSTRRALCLSMFAIQVHAHSRPEPRGRCCDDAYKGP